MGELAAQERRVDVYRDGRRVRGGRWAPEPEVVRPAVDVRQAEPGPVAVDRARLAVVPGEDRRLPLLGGGQRAVLVGDQGHQLRPGDLLAEVIVDLLQRYRVQRPGRQDRQ